MRQLDAASWAASTAEVADLLRRAMARFGVALRGAFDPPPGLGVDGARPAPSFQSFNGFAVGAKTNSRAASEATVTTDDGGSRDEDEVTSAGSGVGDAVAVPVPATTLMVRNIPAECTQESLMNFWTPDGTYDFLYLPRNAGGKANLGYAFLNFVTEAHASAFKSTWQRARFGSTTRRLNVSLAEVQGLDANISRLKAKPAGRMRSRHSAPFVMMHGRVVPWESL